ncbi:MAG: hypothetical protein RLZZ175_955 [Bacteroidota bacterium]|jgi:crotonobetainyl-CoA:carnitine CoA-transferase CaiB-like acyl-CoA transferase
MFTKLRVIELATVLAGPAVGQFFAELGAHVLKIENHNTGGDVTRSWRLSSESANSEYINAYFSTVNWGKQFVGIDISTNEGLAIFYDLIKEADILICNFKPGDDLKLKVDYETLASINPKLIYGHITGYGSNNNRVGFDAIIQAEAGFTFLNAEKGGNGHKMPVALMDVLAAHQLKEGLLVALLKRVENSLGTKVEVSLIQSGISALSNQALNYLHAGVIPKAMGSEHPNIVPYGSSFLTKDNEYLVLAVGTDKQFQLLCKVLEMSDIAFEDRFLSNKNRVENRKELNEILATNMLNFDIEFILNQCLMHNIPAGRINNMEQVFEQPEANELIILSDELNMRGLKQVVASNIESINLTTPKPIGFDTDKVLSQYLSSEKLIELKNKKVIA